MFVKRKLVKKNYVLFYLVVERCFRCIINCINDIVEQIYNVIRFESNIFLKEYKRYEEGRKEMKIMESYLKIVKI